MSHFDHKTAGGFTAWVAIAAVVLNALWPLIAQLEPGEADMQMEGCAEPAMHHAGMQMEGCAEPGMHHAAAENEDSAPAEPSPLMPHCAFCTLAPGGFTVLVAARFDAAPLLVDSKEFRPTPPEVRPLAFFSYSPAHPRAPPVLS